MAQLLVRNLEDDIVRALKKRAREAGHSAEEEHRRIRREALTEQDGASFKEALFSIPTVGDDEDFERIEDPVRDVEL